MESMKRRAIRHDIQEDDESAPVAVAHDTKTAETAETAAPERAANPSPTANPGAGTGPSPDTANPTAPPVAADNGPNPRPAATADAATPTADPPSLSTTRRPPATPLSDQERRDLSRQHLEAIGAALQRYVDKTRRFPAVAIYDSGNSTKLLSWRVELLPHLDLEELYRRFHHDEPWNSPHNRGLLPLIPEVYQSPERFDDRTNYLATVDSGAAFQGPRGVYARKIEDGLANTAVVVEVDEERAVPWTQPED